MDGKKLHAGPNSYFDLPDAADDLPSLPVRQTALIRTLSAALPRNAPPTLSVALKEYADELTARGVQPIVGILHDMAAMVAADIGAENASLEWLEAGMIEGFSRFEENHKLFMSHFPLDAKREDLFASAELDEEAATGQALREPFQNIAEATREAHKAGLTTDDFATVVEKIADLAKSVSTQPLPLRAEKQDGQAEELPSNLRAFAEDKFQPENNRKISNRKRTVLTGLGFAERAYNLAGTTATLATTNVGQILIDRLHAAVIALSKLLL